MQRIMSPTRCVHVVDTTYTDKRGRVTLCNHARYHNYSYGDQYYHKWPVTTSEVTCKRCIASIKRITDKLETKWTLRNKNCFHRFLHPEFGIMCIEPKRTGYCRLRRSEVYKKCVKQYCLQKPVKEHPLESEPGPMVEMVEYILTSLGEEIVETDKKSKASFDMVSSHCPFRKPTNPRRREVTPFRCTNPKLADPQFNWGCDMGACPWMNRALDWRANNNM